MKTATSSGQFQRDVKRLQKRGKDMDKLKALVNMLLAGEPLPPKYKTIHSNTTMRDIGTRMWNLTGC